MVTAEEIRQALKGPFWRVAIDDVVEDWSGDGLVRVDVTWRATLEGHDDQVVTHTYRPKKLTEYRELIDQIDASRS